MSLLLAQNLKRHYGAHEVLRGLDLRIGVGEKIGCVGRNGGGKSTLLRILVGEESADEGQVVVPRGVRVGYVPQSPEFAPGEIAFEHVEHGLDEARELAAELARVEEELGDADGERLERLVERHGELTQRMEVVGGWQTEQLVETVLSGIGLAEALWRREARTLSGGEKARVALARELVRRPDLLYLDEPTNHLDLDGIEWLESYLKELGSAVFVVSHDRRLLDSVTNHIVELERGRLKRYPGNYSRYVVLRRERYESELRAFEIQQDQVRKEESFIKKHMGSQRTSEAKGRQKRLSRLERLERPHDDIRKPVIRMTQVPRSGEMVVSVEALEIGYAGKPLHRGLELRIGRGERIGLVGPNGAGKTTLLQVLAGRRAPLAGTLERGHKAVCGYYDQETADLDPEKTPLATLRAEHPAATDLELRSHLALFLFRGEEVDLPVAGLSGGERARLCLARLVLREPTWLALDEPTNHLDLAARTALEEMLAQYPGALVCISHDREFLDHLCTRILELGPRGLREYRGNYSAYRAALAAEAAASSAKTAAAKAATSKAPQASKPAPAQPSPTAGQPSPTAGQTSHTGAQPSRTAAQTARAAPTARTEVAAGGREKIRNPYLFKKLESEIIALEADRERLLAELESEEVWRDPERLKEHQFRLAELERDLEEKNTTWENWV
jgi:ATP-binding cassette, subfamily F, member 3